MDIMIYQTLVDENEPITCLQVKIPTHDWFILEAIQKFSSKIYAILTNDVYLIFCYLDEIIFVCSFWFAC